MGGQETRKRLDIALTESGLVKTRSRARDLIVRGRATVDGETVRKPGAPVPDGAELAVDERETAYVSRGALKLDAALESFGFGAEGVRALDIGASTGGFTQVLLERGAAHVTAVDVGRGQLDVTLALDRRVSELEGFDARDLTPEHVPDPVTAIAADVSFVSVTKVLPAALALAAPGCWLVALIKPQFEVGREHVGKGGVVRDETALQLAVDTVAGWLAGQPGWRVVDVVRSPVRGRAGNLEFLLGARFQEPASASV